MTARMWHTGVLCDMIPEVQFSQDTALLVLQRPTTIRLDSEKPLDRWVMVEQVRSFESDFELSQ